MLKRLTATFQKIEDIVLVSLLLIMIFMAVIQIFLRNFFDSGILWADPLVRVLVLWLGLVGAMAASRTDNHISIDVISRFLPGHIKGFTQTLVYLFTSGITGLMAWHSYRFVCMEKADGLMAFAGAPAWVCEAIIPAAFAVISLRYALFFLDQMISLFRAKP
ncbi:MAG: TRAP transporter small permease subunit [Desulfobacter sp.]|nr:TRAP transporter small permease subunit [Desulfobacter sp.]